MIEETISTRHVAGLRELGERFRALGEVAAQRALTDVGLAAFAPVLEDAQRLAPVRLGILRDTIRLAAQSPKDARGYSASVGLAMAWKIEREYPSNVPGKHFHRTEGGAYWRWHWAEFGTARTAAHPFLRPALDENVGSILSRLRDELGAKIEAAAKGAKP